MKLKCGLEAEPLPDEDAEKINTNFVNKKHRYVRLQKTGYIYYDSFLKYADKYYDFKFNSDDVLLMGFVRSGTTWCQEILWTMLHNPNLDNPEAAITVNSRVPFFEHDILLGSSSWPRLEPGNVYYDAFVKEFPDIIPKDGIILQTMENRKSPRIAKSHLILSLLNPNITDACKVVYIARNPKDVIVSLYHVMRLVKAVSYIGTFDSLITRFIKEKKDLVCSIPYWDHVLEAWKRRNHPNVHFMFYENLKANPKAEYTRLKDFLGLNLTEKQVDNIVQYTSFDVMKGRESEITKNHGYGYNPNAEKEGDFYRKGVTGDSDKRFTQEQHKKIDEWIRKNVKEFGPDFKYFV